MNTYARSILLVSVLASAAALQPLTGCEKKPQAASTTANTNANTMPDHGHSHGPTVQLGEQTAAGFKIKASRDGSIPADGGGDAPVDVWVTGGSARVAAVRLWIGTEDAKGSVKARAELEKDNWHTHVELPKPLPAGSKLWVEVETDKGEKAVAGFDLKA